jgi:hypothetical protein
MVKDFRLLPDGIPKLRQHLRTPNDFAANWSPVPTSIGSNVASLGMASGIFGFARSGKSYSTREVAPRACPTLATAV